MDAESFQRAERLFHEAMAQTPASRSVFVEHAAGGDERLALRVRRLLQRAEGAATPTVCVDHSAVLDPEADQGDQRLIGATIGRFRIIEVLGEGGFGCVYRAEQHEPIRRSVALKILRSGMDSRQVIARFESERQALALMEHPNIARVYDAGRTGPELGSRPYFAMELVGGGAAAATAVPITVYCDEHQLDIESRLELFITVCQAVQHAHQKGIIHRDLKPSNILVSEVDGVAAPKVIDFGIAKATQTTNRLSDRTLVTEAQQLLGTPQYMSPEQADLDVPSIDTRSDIYSLGVVLYELLTGSTPIDSKSLREASYSRMQAMIRGRAVERPSTRVSRLQRSEAEDRRSEIRGQKAQGGHRGLTSDLRPLTSAVSTRRLRGDLDWIVLKALEPDRDRRYSSASMFAEDIRRHLNHEPVLAGPPSAAYRLRKFVRRHRVGVAAAALVALAVIGGAVGTTLGMLRARESAEQASSINDFMREVLMSANPSHRGADVRLAEVLQNASATAAQRFEGHPEVEATVRDMLGRVFLSLDFMNESISEFKHAAMLAESMFGTDDRRTIDGRLHYIQALIAVERMKEAERVLNETMPGIERSLSSDDGLALHATRLVASVHKYWGRLDEAERTLRDVRQRARDSGHYVTYINACDELVGLLRRRMGDAANKGEPLDRAMHAEAEAMAREMIGAAQRHVGPESLPALRGKSLLADMLLRRGDVAGAAETCQAILAVSRERLGDCHAVRLYATGILSHAMHALGDAAAAADLRLDEIDCARSRNMSPVNVLSCMSDALPFLDRGRRWAEGETLAREFCELVRQVGGGHGDMLYNGEVYIARFIALQGRLDEAESLFQGLLQREHEIEGDRSRARLHMFHGSLLAQRGMHAQAEQELLTATEALGDIRRGATASHPDDLVLAFIALNEAWGKPEKVEEYQRLRDDMRRPLTSDL